jgi:hypothetical protein
MEPMMILAICAIPTILLINGIRYGCFFCVNEDVYKQSNHEDIYKKNDKDQLQVD